MKFIGKESSTLEFKEEIPKSSQIIHTIIGFCNSHGGRLVIGVRDDGTICGVPEYDVEGMIASLQESIYKSCTPPILPSIYTQRIGDKIVVIIEVSSGMNRPYFLTSAGLHDGTYIRLGSHTYKADGKMIQELQWEARGLSVDTLPVYQATIEDLDKDQINNFLKNRKQELQNIDIDSALVHYQLITTEHNRSYPTVAGILLFGKNPQQFFSEAFIICSHFKGISGREAIASMDCEGNLLSQFEEALNFITRNLDRSFKIEGIKREEKLEIPLSAIREVLLNAIVHRQYQIPGPTKIAIYDDRLEFFTPGGFPGPLQTDQLEMGYTYIRNHAITKIFRELGYIEKLGSGFLTLFQSYRERKLPEPRIIEGDNFVKSVLPRKKSGIFVSKSSEQEILRIFDTAEEITVNNVIHELSTSRQTAVRLLNILIGKGLIKRIGKSSATRYRRS